jgi:hypothetical protein
MLMRIWNLMFQEKFKVWAELYGKKFRYKWEKGYSFIDSPPKMTIYNYNKACDFLNFMSWYINNVQ